MLESLLNLLCRHRRTTLLAAVVLLLAGAGLATRLSVNDSSERWLPTSSLEAWRKFEEHCDYGDTVAIAIEFRRPVRDDDIGLLKSLRRELLALDGIARVTDVSAVAEEIEGVPLTEFLRTPGPGEKDPFRMYRGILFDDPRLRDGPHAEPGSQEARGEGGPHPLPLSQGEKGEEEGRTLLTVIESKTAVEPGLDPQAQQEDLNRRRRALVAGVYRVLDEHRRDDVIFHAAGGVVIQYELEDIARREIVTTVPAAIVLTIVVLGVGFRSLGAVAVVALGGLWSIAVMLGGVAWAGWTMNVVTVGGPTLLAVIGVTTTIHFAHYYASHPGGVGPSGDSPPGAHARHFVRWVGVACLGVAVVTGVGFLMLAFNELNPARELGIELFAGSVLAFFGAFFAWLWIHPFRAGPPRWLTAAGFRRYNAWITARPWPTTLAVMAVMAVAGVAACWVRIDVDPFSFFQPGSRVADALQHFSERKFGLYILDVVLVPRRRPDDALAREASRADDRRAALGLQQAIAAQPEVRNVISALDLQARAGGFDLRSERDWKRAMAFLETFVSWTRDKAGQDAMRISFMVCDGGQGFGPLVAALEREAASPEVAGRFEVVHTGTAANVVTLSKNLVGGISKGLWTAAGVMAVLCFALFRSIRLTLVAVLPNALPVVVVFGVMGLFGVPLNSGSAMVASIALGIALNDTIHFVMHYHRRRAMGETADEALADTAAALGRPLVMTSVVNCLGFGIFLLSDFRPMFHFGLLASISMVAALAGDIILLPNMLKLADRNGRGTGKAPATGNTSSFVLQPSPCTSAPSPSALPPA